MLSSEIWKSALFVKQNFCISFIEVASLLDIWRKFVQLVVSQDRRQLFCSTCSVQVMYLLRLILKNHPPSFWSFIRRACNVHVNDWKLSFEHANVISYIKLSLNSSKTMFSLMQGLYICFNNYKSRPFPRIIANIHNSHLSLCVRML